jgi:hypothetical protein
MYLELIMIALFFIFGKIFIKSIEVENKLEENIEKYESSEANIKKTK